MKKIITFLLIFLLCGCSNEQMISKNLFYMDTVINVKIYTDKNTDDVFNYIDNLYKKYENITSFYNEESELYKLNNSEEKELTISNELYELLELGINWHDKSNGLLNINIGSITSLWHDFREGKVDFPTLEELNKDIDIDNIKLLNSNKIEIDNVNIDLGSIVKGYVTELAGKYLEEQGFDKYIINAGGNVKVGNSNKENYTIGIASPNKEGSIMTIKANNVSVVTSGGYERFFEYNGKIYHHIIDPKTYYPAEYMKSVTVIGKDSGEADALSTILFLMSIEDGKEFIKNYDIDVIWIDNDDNIIKSEGFRYE